MADWVDRLSGPPWNWAILAAVTFVAALTAFHALLYKRDPRASLGWIAICVIFPVAGPLLYFLFGINRIHTRARRLHDRNGSATTEGGAGKARASVDHLRLPPEFAELARTANAVSRHRLVGGNTVELLHNGEQVYPAMLDAINGARHTLFLATYILETNRTGRRFIEALAAATRRGVDVRVLVDGVGELYSFPRAGRLLRKRGVAVHRYLPPRLIPPSFAINLRNHRKILVADGGLGFTGGINIGDRHLAESPKKSRVTDFHFRLTGPIVEQIERVFLEDWGFASGDRELRPREESGPEPEAEGAICRTIVDGPNEDLDKLEPLLVGAVASAATKVSIMTPYFLPPRALIAALQSAALRGVDVAVILPSRNNLPFVHWATQNMLWELLQRGVQVYYQPPPFAHSKLFVVDRHYAQIGSANLDPRSLRLNFELAVEVYDRDVAWGLDRHFEDVRVRSHRTTLAALDGRSLPVRVRDALAWLFSPYL